MTKVLLLELTIRIINFLSRSLRIALTTLQIESFKKHLMIKKIVITTRQPKKLGNLLVREKLETKAIPKPPKLTGLFICSNCVYHKAGYIIPCSSEYKEYKEKRYILWWKPPLNFNKTWIMMELINNFLIDKFVILHNSLI